MGLLYFRLPFEPKSHFLPPNKKRAPALLSQHEIGGLNVYACIRIAPTHASRGGVRDDSAFAPRERERMTMYSTVAPRLFIALFLVFWPSPPSLSRSFLAHDQDLLAGCGARRCHLHPPPPIIQRVLYLSLPRDCFFHLTHHPTTTCLPRLWPRVPSGGGGGHKWSGLPSPSQTLSFYPLPHPLFSPCHRLSLEKKERITAPPTVLFLPRVVPQRRRRFRDCSFLPLYCLAFRANQPFWFFRQPPSLAKKGGKSRKRRKDSFVVQCSRGGIFFTF